MFDLAIVGGGIAAVEAVRYIVATKQPVRDKFHTFDN